MNLANEGKPNGRGVLALFSGVLAVRVLAIVLCPTDLAGDEAYYWEWGQHPAWGYYSKPPGIAWIMALAAWLGNDSVIGIRLIAAAFSMGTGFWIYQLCRLLYDEQTALLGSALFFVTPAAAGLSFLLTIDSPLMFFWSGALYFFFRSIESESQRSKRHLAALALCVAGGILVKQMMMIFPLIATVVLLQQKKSRPIRSASAPLIAALFLPFLVLIPSLFWNAKHDWPTLRHTSEHFAASTDDNALEMLSRLGEFLGSQLLLASPVIAVLIIWLLCCQLPNWRTSEPTQKGLWIFCAPGIFAMLAATVWQRINPNWPAVFYLAGIVLFVGWLREGSTTTGNNHRWARCSLISGASITIVLYLALALTSRQIGPQELRTQSQRLHGWSQLATEVQKHRDLCPNPDKTIIITRSHRFLTSQLAFNLPDHPRVYRYAYSNDGAIDSQHGYWPGPETALGCDALIVSVGNSGRLPSTLSERFTSVEKIAAIDGFETTAGGPITFFLGRDLQQWSAIPTNKSTER